MQLSPTPTSDPQFYVEVPHAHGEKFKLADPKATRAMVALMDMNAVLGGAASHYGGPAAFAELMSALHAFMFWEAQQKQAPWYELYNFVNDAGHCENGLYALRANYGFADLTIDELKKFRSIESRLTGHGEAHLFPEGVLLSNGPLGSAFPQSQGLAMADAQSKKDRVTVTAISDGACMEGEAREALAALPGLAQKGKVAPFVLIISDNNTKLSGRIDKDSFSMEPTFQSMKTLGWGVLELKDGHSLQQCLFTLEHAIKMARENPKVPIAIHARTIKGIGTKKTADSSSGGHGFPCKSATEVLPFIQEIYGDHPLPAQFIKWAEELVELEKKIKATAIKDTGEKIQVGVANALIKAKKAGLPIVSITSDLPGSTGVSAFQKEFPNDYFDVGVAEANMISVGAGFSRQGFIPVVDTFAQFGVTKGALPLTMAMLSHSPIIAVFSHTGFQDAADGASHQALTYFSMVSSIPGVRVVALSCSEQAEALVSEALNEFHEKKSKGEIPPSTIFFLGRENFPKSFGASSNHLNQANILFEKLNKNKNVVLLTAGSLVGQALLAAKKLEEMNIGSIVIESANVNHIDVNLLKDALYRAGGHLITIEDHQLIGGFGAMVSHKLLLNGVEFKLKSLGVKGEFGRSAYNAIELYRLHGLDAQAIVQSALQF